MQDAPRPSDSESGSDTGGTGRGQCRLSGQVIMMQVLRRTSGAAAAANLKEAKPAGASLAGRTWAALGTVTSTQKSEPSTSAVQVFKLLLFKLLVRGRASPRSCPALACGRAATCGKAGDARFSSSRYSASRQQQPEAHLGSGVPTTGTMIAVEKTANWLSRKHPPGQVGPQPRAVQRMVRRPPVGSLNPSGP
jgi:hypothetical protein